MATENLSIGPSWSKVADASHGGFAAQADSVGHLEWATTDADAAPAVGLVGLRLPAQTVVGRGLIEEHVIDHDRHISSIRGPLVWVSGIASTVIAAFVTVVINRLV